METNWLLKPFQELSPEELYKILLLRNEVFVVEQNCVFQDADNKDQGSDHLMCFQVNKLAAYARILPPGLAYEEASIGRIVTSSTVRKSGIGRELVHRALDITLNKYGAPVRIGAQLYLLKFYSSFGFVPNGEVYLEDGIEHIEMVFSSSSL